MDEQKNSGLMSNLTPQQTFVFGLVGGILVLCTVGFFILLAVMYGGGDGVSTRTTTTSVDGPKQFSQCLDSGEKAPLVQQDFNLGASLGVNGTPATFINGYLVSGALPYEAMQQVVDAVLAGKEPDFDFMKDQDGNITKVDMPELPNAIWRGNENANVTVVEFSDFECPYCYRFDPTVKQLLANYGDKIKFTYRHFPLSFHPQAQKAAEAYECAKAQGKGWEMHDKLFELNGASSLSVSSYKQAATSLKLK